MHHQRELCTVGKAPGESSFQGTRPFLLVAARHSVIFPALPTKARHGLFKETCMHALGLWELQGSGFRIREGQGLCPRAPSPQTLELGSWPRPLFVLERCGWKAERSLGSWEQSVGGFSTSRTPEKGACARHRRGPWRAGRSGRRAVPAPPALCEAAAPRYLCRLCV